MILTKILDRTLNIFGFLNHLIKETISYFVIPFTRLVNKFPHLFKITKVIPIFIKGSKEQLVIYRPISLVPVLSKIVYILLGGQLTH